MLIERTFGRAQLRRRRGPRSGPRSRSRSGCRSSRRRDGARRRPAPAGRRSSGRRSGRRGGAGRRPRAAAAPAGCGRTRARPARSVSAAMPQIVGPVLDRMLGEALEQLVVAVGVGATPLLVGEPGVDDRAHHPQRQRRVGARASGAGARRRPGRCGCGRGRRRRAGRRCAAPRGASATDAARSTSGSSPRSSR